MKKAIHSLLGIEMSIGQREFKPFLLCIGVLSFILLSIPLLAVYSFLYFKFTLLESLKELKKHKDNNKYKGVRGV